MSQDRHRRSVRRVLLSDGRAIDVVSVRDPRALHVCPDCECEHVQPLEWGETGAQTCALTLLCPNCLWQQEGLYDHRDVERFEEKLDEGLAALICDLRRLTHANMADQVDRFAEALRVGLVQPEDF